MNGLRDLYQQMILDHHRRPRNWGRLVPADAEAEGHNPLCGDRLQITLRLDEDGRIEDVRFQGEGCAISVASASMMTEAVKGKTKQEALSLFDQFHAMLTEDGTPADALGKLAVLSGVRAYPMRVKCATLAWHTLKQALEQGKGVTSTE